MKTSILFSPIYADFVIFTLQYILLIVMKTLLKLYFIKKITYPLLFFSQYILRRNSNCDQINLNDFFLAHVAGYVNCMTVMTVIKGYNYLLINNIVRNDIEYNYLSQLFFHSRYSLFYMVISSFIESTMNDC